MVGLNWIQRTDKKFLIVILISIVGVIIGVVSLYPALRESRPDLSFEIINEANVLDVHTPLKDLSIVFQGQDIQESKLNLRIFTIRLENSGGTDILQGHYDRNDVWGFRVKDGEVIEARLTESSSAYVEDNLKPSRVDAAIVSFEKIIFERDASFVIEALVVHSMEES